MHFKPHFNIADEITYLNTPGNGLLPKDSLNWRQEWEQEFFDSRTDLRDKQVDFLANVKKTVASFFTSHVENTYLLPNFSFGYSTLIDLLPSDFRYVVLADEYPSLQYPIVSRGLEHITVPVTVDVEEKLEAEIQRSHPDVLILSLVQYISGLKINLDFLKRIKQAYPDLLIIADGTQFLGTEPFNFQESGIDALGGSGYKWLLSGFGNGFMLLSEKLRSLLEDLLIGRPKPTVAMWQHKSVLDTFFEPGHQDNLSHGTLQKSMQWIQSIGLDTIHAHNQSVSEEAYKLFAERNLLLPIIQKRSEKSFLINVQVDPACYPHIQQMGIKCFPRGTGIRIGIHVYNDIADIHRFVNILESIK